MVDRKTTGPISIEREWFIDSKQGNIKDEYYFEKKLGSGGYGAVYLAKHKKTGKSFSPRAWRVIIYFFSRNCELFIGVKVAVKAMQKGRI